MVNTADNPQPGQPRLIAGPEPRFTKEARLRFHVSASTSSPEFGPNDIVLGNPAVAAPCTVKPPSPSPSTQSSVSSSTASTDDLDPQLSIPPEILATLYRLPKIVGEQWKRHPEWETAEYKDICVALWHTPSFRKLFDEIVEDPALTSLSETELTKLLCNIPGIENACGPKGAGLVIIMLKQFYVSAEFLFFA